MKHSQDIRNVALGAILAVIGLSANAAINLTTFTPNTPIKSSEVNANFSSLKANIEALQAPIGVSRLAITGTAADGKVLKLQAGNLAWSDDLTGGSGGAAYSAGTGLALTGTTFSLADSGVTLDKLSATGGADGKVLKISGGKLAWLDDIVGSPGSTYSADDSSLVLTGTKFSVKDGGITSSKIAFPLSAMGAFGASSGITVQNSSTGGSTGALHGIGGEGVSAGSEAPIGVLGESKTGSGVFGASQTGDGVSGRGSSAGSIGVSGFNIGGEGVLGQSSSSTGVHGTSDSGFGVFGQSGSNFALLGINNSSTASALKIQNQASKGGLIDAVGRVGNNIQTVFTVNQDGTVITEGDVFARGVKLTSDRNAKTNFRSVDARAVLERIAALPVTRWNYKSDASSEQHIGPMAQDFHAAFGLSGSDDKHISAVDAQGVALTAIKGLNAKLETEKASLRVTLAALEARMEVLEKAARAR